MDRNFRRTVRHTHFDLKMRVTFAAVTPSHPPVVRRPLASRGPRGSAFPSRCIRVRDTLPSGSVDTIGRRWLLLAVVLCRTSHRRPWRRTASERAPQHEMQTSLRRTRSSRYPDTGTERRSRERCLGGPVEMSSFGNARPEPMSRQEFARSESVRRLTGRCSCRSGRSQNRWRVIACQCRNALMQVFISWERVQPSGKYTVTDADCRAKEIRCWCVNARRLGSVLHHVTHTPQSNSD